MLHLLDALWAGGDPVRDTLSHPIPDELDSYVHSQVDITRDLTFAYPLIVRQPMTVNHSQFAYGRHSLGVVASGYACPGSAAALAGR